jgi:outer membrane receptor protein involved in Fe transport
MRPARRRTGAEITRTLAFIVISIFIAVISRRSRADDAPVEVAVHGDTSANAASDVAVGHVDLQLRPQRRADDMVEAVPGLFTVQHSGGFKAQQYFLRGFDADHGTDIAFSLDGVPLNAVSHAHGQGYTDLHFLIPEVVASVSAAKGPYSPAYGDFATAGAVDIRTVDRLPESLASLEIGPYAHTRAVAVESPDLGEPWHAIVAAELFADDGYFAHPENGRRVNAFARVARAFDDGSRLALTLMGYSATWNASGIIPVRAVCGESDGNPPPEAYGAHCIGRYDSIDPSQGGWSSRSMISLSYGRPIGAVDVQATAFGLRSRLALFTDDTLFADDPIHGAGIEQDDARSVVGANVRAKHSALLGRVELTSTLGVQPRLDVIDNALHRQAQRQRLGTEVASRIDETELGAYLDEEARITRWLRLRLGARVDRVDMAVHDADPEARAHAAGARGAALFSPKAAAVVSPAAWLDLFGDYGQGFHSNDARGVVDGGATLLAVATGYELGVVVRPIRHLSLSAAAFLLDLSSELVFDGDTATTAPSGPTRREGIEVTARYHFGSIVFADAALTLTRARFRDAVSAEGANSSAQGPERVPGPFVPLAPRLTFAAGIGARKPVGPFTPFASVRVKSIADRPATQDGSLVAQGFTLLDLQAGVRWKSVEGAVEVLNALDSAWREGQFATTSRLPYEPVPVTAMSFTPGWPREVLARVTFYW